MSEPMKKPEDLKRGPVHSGDEKPTYAGVWERDYRQYANEPEDWGFAYFNGEHWMCRRRTVESSAMVSAPSNRLTLPWRGQCEVPPDSAKAANMTSLHAKAPL